MSHTEGMRSGVDGMDTRWHEMCVCLCVCVFQVWTEWSRGEHRKQLRKPTEHLEHADLHLRHLPPHRGQCVSHLYNMRGCVCVRVCVFTWTVFSASQLFWSVSGLWHWLFGHGELNMLLFWHFTVNIFHLTYRLRTCLSYMYMNTQLFTFKCNVQV